VLELETPSIGENYATCSSMPAPAALAKLGFSRADRGAPNEGVESSNQVKWIYGRYGYGYGSRKKDLIAD